MDSAIRHSSDAADPDPLDGRTLIPDRLLDSFVWEPHAARGPRIDVATVERASAWLERFAAELSAHERAALEALLALADADASLHALAAEPAEMVLTPREVAVYERLAAQAPPAGPALRRSMVLIVKGTRLCDLRCTYCYSWGEGPNQVMSFPVLARMTRDILRAPGVEAVEFVWHGGEPTLLPPAFYCKALWLQEQFRRPGQVISNRVQTNAAHLKSEWIGFWRRYRFGVGVSLDGPPQIHDRRRVDTKGRPTAARVQVGLKRLQAAGLDPSVYVVIDDDIIALGAERLLAWLRELGVSRVGVLNVVPATAPDAPAGELYLAWPRYVAFLRDLFRCWWPEHAGRLVIRELADLVAQVAGRPAGVCIYAGDCHGGFLTVEPNGVVSVCDKYLGDDRFRLGNLATTGLVELTESPRLAAVRSESEAALNNAGACSWFAVCHGGCPYDRYIAERRMSGVMQRCCGFAPLLDDIADALRAAGLPVQTGPHAGSAA